MERQGRGEINPEILGGSKVLGNTPVVSNISVHTR